MRAPGWRTTNTPFSPQAALPKPRSRMRVVSNEMWEAFMCREECPAASEYEDHDPVPGEQNQWNAFLDACYHFSVEALLWEFWGSERGACVLSMALCCIRRPCGSAFRGQLSVGKCMNGLRSARRSGCKVMLQPSRKGGVAARYKRPCHSARRVCRKKKSRYPVRWRVNSTAQGSPMRGRTRIPTMSAARGVRAKTRRLPTHTTRAPSREPTVETTQRFWGTPQENHGRQPKD